MLYGTTVYGGSSGQGTVFSLSLGAPQLTITESGTNIILTWPANATNWTLLQNTNLATTNWTAFAAANVGNNGILKTATNQPAGGNKFFRLMHP